MSTLVVSVFIFQSCSGNLKNKTNSLQAESTVDTTYAPVGVVPEWAKEHMTEEEEDMWTVISSKYKVDYSFLLNPKWQSAKDRINKNLYQLCNNIKNGAVEDTGGSLSVDLSNNISHSLNKNERLDYAGNSRLIENNKNISRRFSVRGNSIYFTAHVSCYKLEGNIIDTVVHSHYFEFPYGSRFAGSSGCHAANNESINVYCVGNLYIASEVYPVDINVIVYI